MLSYCITMTSKKNIHAVALGRLGGAATKGISTPRKKLAATQAIRSRWARPMPDELRPFFWREQGLTLLPMEMAQILYTRAPLKMPRAVNRRTAMRFALKAPTEIQRRSRRAFVQILYGAH